MSWSMQIVDGNYEKESVKQIHALKGTRPCPTCAKIEKCQVNRASEYIRALTTAIDADDDHNSVSGGTILMLCSFYKPKE